jgi:hypothetical protein
MPCNKLFYAQVFSFLDTLYIMAHSMEVLKLVLLVNKLQL